jgi:ubiquinone biosynthesis protein UbiJ
MPKLPDFAACTPPPQLLARTAVAACNHLLQGDAAARARLQAHAGKQIALRIGGLDVALGVSACGDLDFLEAAAEPALRLDVDPGAVAAAQLRGQPLGLSGVRISGDAEFAQAVSWLLGNLRWDAEDDLARYVGDVAAHRMARATRDAVAVGKRLSGRAETGLRDWLASQPRALPARAEFSALAAAVAAQRDALARLDKRIALLRRAATGS